MSVADPARPIRARGVLCMQSAWYNPQRLPAGEPEADLELGCWSDLAGVLAAGPDPAV